MEHSVLIVDDERMIVNSLVFGFDWKASGFQVVATALSGREAIDLIRIVRPEVVLTDMKMPGMTGTQLMEACQALEDPPRFIIISGHADFRYAQEAMRLGAAGYCLKPVENDELAETLGRVREELEARAAAQNDAMRLFLADPRPENLRPLLSAFRAGEQVAVVLADGDASPQLSAILPTTACRVGEMCQLCLVRGDLTLLESYAFRASLLGAVTAGSFSAFLYDVTTDPAAFLPRAIEPLLDQLYVGFLSENQTVLGRAKPDAPGETAFSEHFRALCNHNRPREAAQCLSALTREEIAALTLRDAVTVYNQSQMLLCRMRNEACPMPLSYAYELAERYGTFAAMADSLCRSLNRTGDKSFNAEKLHNDTLQQVVEELNRTFTGEISYQELCGRYRISPSYLSQLFKKELGITFTTYLNGLRMDYARELLETTRLLVAEVSEKAGYDNYLNFTKLFKRETGLTPTQYRTAHAGDPRE